MWHSRPRLCGLLLPSRFPAIGDLGQELTEMVNLFITPDVNNSLAMVNGFRRGNLADPDVIGQSFVADTEFLCSFAS